MKTNNLKCCHFCENSSVRIILGILAIIVIFFLAVRIAKDIKSYDYIGRDISAPNTISVSGKGEILTKADIANFTFNVIEESLNVSEAQERAALKMNKIIEFLAGNGVEDRDIKTINYNISPRYEYVKSSEKIKAPTRNNRVLVGYEVSQGVGVKIRNIDSIGSIVAGVGDFGASNVSGLNFSIDEEDNLKKEARELAIEDAREEAKVLAKGLGVKLVRIINFSESGYFPIYREKFSSADMSMSVGGAIAPEIPAGEDKITSQVNIVYEIK